MDFVALVAHGLTAMSVFGELIGVRLLLVSSLLGIVAALAITIVVAARSFTEIAVPGWATLVVGVLLLITLHAVMLSVIFSFVILGSRNSSAFLPVRDYHFYVGRVDAIHVARSNHFAGKTDE